MCRRSGRRNNDGSAGYRRHAVPWLLGAALAFVTFGFTAMGLTPQDSGIPASGVDIGAVVASAAAALLVMAAGAALVWRVLSGR